MKKLIFAGVAMLMLAFTGCKGTGSSDKQALASQQDSLATAFGEYFAAQYAQQEMYTPDSLRLDKAEFLKGVKVALAADTTKAGKSYLAGLQMGLQMFSQLQQLEKEYGVSGEKVLEAFKVAIAKDSIDTDMAVIGPRIQNLIGKVKEAKLADNAEAQANKKATEGYLNTLKKNGAKSMRNGLVYQVLENGNGAKVNASDIVNVVITVTDKNGTVLQSTNGEPQQMPASQFGQIHPMLAEGITAMHVGDHFKFYVNLGAEVPQNFKPYDFIVFDIKLVEPAAAEKAEPEE